MTEPLVSVLIATYQRHDGLRLLLDQLAGQTMPADRFEVVVVDDGSTVPLTLDDVHPPYALRLINKPNGGPASARHRGAEEARGELLVVVDDDMQVQPDFLDAHARVHTNGKRRAALGPIDPDPNVTVQPLFEQWNAERLARVTRDARAGATIRGNNLWTGNVSFRRADYFDVGGFDLALRVSEDLELGMRLEEHGVEITFAPDAVAVHHSDHGDATWLRRAPLCGRLDKAVALKHPHAVHADPWRYYYMLPRFVRPALSLAISAPGVSERLARLFLRLGQALLKAGARGPALRVAAIVYAMEYVRGLRIAEGSRRAALDSRDAYLARAASLPTLPAGVPRRKAHWKRMRADLAADRATRLGNEDRYGYAGERGGGALSSFVQKIGVQIMTAIRFMIFFRDAGHPILARLCSRMIRHLYGSDVHWDSQWGPGTTVIHGFGLAISNEARIGPDCIIFQNVCLGMGIDAETRQSGAPTLERRVNIGPGATLTGPITVGAETKVMAGVTLGVSVPARSLVEAPTPVIRSRAPRDQGAESSDGESTR